MEICTNCGSNSTKSIDGGKYYCDSCREVFSPYIKKIVVNQSQKNEPISNGAKIFSNNIGKTLSITAASPNSNSNGSGFIIGSSGYIITNAHVVLNNQTPYDVIVTKFDGEETIHKLLLIDYNDDLDLAVLKFSTEPNAIAPIKLSMLTQAITGEEVYVLGNAKSLGISMTKGIVSAANHLVNKKEYIMIDNAINSGNSGGPAFNSAGACLGVVTSSLSGAIGMSFIIPPRVVVQFIKQVSSDYNLVIL